MSENGEQTGGIVGFYNNLIRLVTRVRPEVVHVIWEGGGSKRKRDLYPEYKKGSRPQKLNRYYEDIPDSFENRNYQLKKLIEILRVTPVNQIYIEDAEADDAIGYICCYKLKDKNKIIVSSDHDYYQLINKNTIVWSPTLKAFVNHEKVLDRFLVHPHNFCLAKSIVGDSSDNIPGVKGVGFKNLAKAFPNFSLENEYVLEEFFKDSQGFSVSSKRKMFERINESTDLIKRNLRLVRLDTNNLSHEHIKKIDSSLENLKISWNNMNAHKVVNQDGIRGIDLLSCNQIFRQLSKG